MPYFFDGIGHARPARTGTRLTIAIAAKQTRRALHCPPRHTLCLACIMARVAGGTVKQPHW